MPELNYNILVENIRALMKRDNMTQQQLADITGMTQANISRALNPEDKRRFTLEQVFLISSYFHVSIDELTGNNHSTSPALTPRTVFETIIELLKTGQAKVTSCVQMEEVFEYKFDWEDTSCEHRFQEIEYPAIYFPSYIPYDNTGLSRDEAAALYAEYSQIGNSTAFRSVNEIISKMLPMIELYKKKEIPDDAFQMIVDGYIKKYYLR